MQLGYSVGSCYAAGHWDEILGAPHGAGRGGGSSGSPRRCYGFGCISPAQRDTARQSGLDAEGGEQRVVRVLGRVPETTRDPRRIGGGSAPGQRESGGGEGGGGSGPGHRGSAWRGIALGKEP